jgi:uncharacterized protein DUF4386
MSSDRKTARITGILFIIATAVSIGSAPFLTSISSSNYLVDVSANANQLLVGALLTFIAAIASASIAISLYPVLKKYNGSLALAAVGFRLIEGVLYVVGIVSMLGLLALSQEFVKAGAPSSSSAPHFQTLGVILVAEYHWVNYVGAVLAFCLGALMYYIIFYQTKLVPRWLSGWGLGAVILTIASSLLVMFNAIGAFSTAQVVLNLPIAVQEMALAVWLIIKGFNPKTSILNT